VTADAIARGLAEAIGIALAIVPALRLAIRAEVRAEFAGLAQTLPCSKGAPPPSPTPAAPEVPCTSSRSR
jgi:hypothetical protein